MELFIKLQASKDSIGNSLLIFYRAQGSTYMMTHLIQIVAASMTRQDTERRELKTEVAFWPSSCVCPQFDSLTEMDQAGFPACFLGHA